MVVAHLRVCYFYTQNQPPGVPLLKGDFQRHFCVHLYGLGEKGDVSYESDDKVQKNKQSKCIFDR